MNDSRQHASGRRHETQGGGKGRPGQGGGGGERRGAPPEMTGAETHYLIKNMEARTPMVVRLVDNEEVHGWIEYYDRKMIKLNRRQPPHLFIRKENIKYIYKDEEASQEPREKP
jgi:small nuclear ribonucleoprotein (snRNP)-like protein